MAPALQASCSMQSVRTEMDSPLSGHLLNSTLGLCPAYFDKLGTNMTSVQRVNSNYIHIESRSLLLSRLTRPYTAHFHACSHYKLSCQRVKFGKLLTGCLSKQLRPQTRTTFSVFESFLSIRASASIPLGARLQEVALVCYHLQQTRANPFHFPSIFFSFGSPKYHTNVTNRLCDRGKREGHRARSCEDADSW